MRDLITREGSLDNNKNGLATAEGNLPECFSKAWKRRCSVIFLTNLSLVFVPARYTSSVVRRVDRQNWPSRAPKSHRIRWPSLFSGIYPYPPRGQARRSALPLEKCPDKAVSFGWQATVYITLSRLGEPAYNWPHDDDSERAACQNKITKERERKREKELPTWSDTLVRFGRIRSSSSSSSAFVLAGRQSFGKLLATLNHSLEHNGRGNPVIWSYWYRIYRRTNRDFVVRNVFTSSVFRIVRFIGIYCYPLRSLGESIWKLAGITTLFVILWTHFAWFTKEIKCSWFVPGWFIARCYNLIARLRATRYDI